MCQYALEAGKQTKEWILLKIDPKKVSNLKLYRDNAFQGNKNEVVFTYNNISPNAIVASKSMNSAISKYKEKVGL